MVTADDTPYRVQVAVGTHGYVADLKEFKQTTIPTLRQSQDTGGEPGEQSLNTEGLWRRSGSDWSLGTGQRVYDGDTSSRRRFQHSQGVNVWDRYELSLLNSTSVSRAPDAATYSQILVVASGNLYHFDASNIYYNSDPFGAGVWTAVTRAATSEVKDLATNGTTVWAAYGADGIDKLEGTTLTSGFAAGNYTSVGYANGRLIAGSGNSSSIYELDSAGAATLLFTHPDSSFRWTEITSAPNGIYLAGYSGSKSEIYVINSTEATGALAVPIYSGSMPDGEIVNAMTFYGGILLVGTDRGVRIANITSSGGAIHGPLVRINDFRSSSRSNNGVRSFAPVGEFVWFNWIDTLSGTKGSVSDGPVSGVGRLDLSRFTEPLVPAYAADLDAGSGGIPISVVALDGKIAFANTSGGVHIENVSSLVSEGYVDTGEILYGTTETKVVATADVSHEPLAGSVEVILIDSDNVSTSLGSSSTAGSTGPSSEFNANDSVGERFRLRIKLIPDSTDTSKGPTLRRWTSKALVAPERVDELIIPVLLFEQVETIDNQYLHMDTKSEYLYLKGLEADGTVVNVTIGDSDYSCRLDRVQMTPVRWNDDRTFFEGVCTLRFITVKPVV